MKNIFKDKKEGAVMADAPEGQETPGEIKHIEEMSNDDKKVSKTTPQPEVQYQEVPVFLSQAQINNMIIENNMMLKQIISEQ